MVQGRTWHRAGHYRAAVCTGRLRGRSSWAAGRGVQVARCPPPQGQQTCPGLGPRTATWQLWAQGGAGLERPVHGAPRTVPAVPVGTGSVPQASVCMAPMRGQPVIRSNSLTLKTRSKVPGAPRGRLRPLSARLSSSFSVPERRGVVSGEARGDAVEANAVAN